MTYGQSLRAGWLLIWRGVAGAFLVGIAASLFMLVFIGLLSTVGIAIRGNAETAFRGLLNALVLIFIINPVLVRMIMDKDFKGFGLEIVRPEREEGELTLEFGEFEFGDG